MLSRIFSILVIKNLLNAVYKLKEGSRRELGFFFPTHEVIYDLKQFLLIFFAVNYFVIIIYSLTLLNKIGNVEFCSHLK